jgi:hypothetical protein
VTPAGVISTVAGNGTAGFSGDGGPATSASLNFPYSVTVDALGNLYISDTINNRIRQVNAAGLINTIAGIGTAGFGGDGGPATSASLNQPRDVAFDTAGNLYIADTLNYRIRMVTPSGVITTVAGNGAGGSFGGDGAAATSAQLNQPSGIAVDSAGDLFIADTANSRIRVVTRGGTAYSVVDRGGKSLISTGARASASVGYGLIQPNPNSTTPSALAIFGFRQKNVLVSETGVPASLPLSAGRIYAEIGGPVDTGVAIVNPNDSPVTLNFFFTDNAGNDFGAGSTTIAANGQTATFLDQAPYNLAAPFQGTFSFTSTLPVGVIALRGYTNERGEFLMSTLPVIDTTAAPANGTLVLPDYADGGGWTAQILLVNPTDALLTGSVKFSNPDGTTGSVTIAGQTSNSFSYSIPAHSSQKLVTSGAGTTTAGGSVSVVPAGNVTPAPLVVFSYKPGQVTVSEAGVPVTAGTALRMYVESAGTSGKPGNIQSGVAVANISSSNATVTFEVTQLDGTPLRGFIPVSINLAGGGQASKFLSDIFPTLPNPFKGVLRISTTSSGVSVVGLRTRYNERSDFLVTTTPPAVESATPTAAQMVFPQLADGGGYTTQIILFSGASGQSSSGSLRLYDTTGQSLNIILR